MLEVILQVNGREIDRIRAVNLTPSASDRTQAEYEVSDKKMVFTTSLKHWRCAGARVLAAKMIDAAIRGSEK